MAGLADVYVMVHLEIDINGEPITKVMKAPAEMEDPNETPGHLNLHLKLDAMELARILYPMICELAKNQAGQR